MGTPHAFFSAAVIAAYITSPRLISAPSSHPHQRDEDAEGERHSVLPKRAHEALAQRRSSPGLTHAGTASGGAVAHARAHDQAHDSAGLACHAGGRGSCAGSRGEPTQTYAPTRPAKTFDPTHQKRTCDTNMLKATIECMHDEFQLGEFFAHPAKANVRAHI